MKLLILGATGPTGQQLLTQALETGHEVAALVRDPAKITASVEVIRGDATDAAAIAGAARGRDAVLSALGTGKSFRGDVVSRAAANLIAASVQRLVFVSAFGVGESFSEAALPQKFFFRTLLRSIYADKAKADEMIRASNAEWTIVRPVMLTNGPRTGQYRVLEHARLSGFPKVSRADVADFMIRELTERKWIRKTVVITT
jgi:uncharacterized protein YbjT (DUF2867 family)